MFDPTQLTATINGVDHTLNLDPVERSTGDGISQLLHGVDVGFVVVAGQSRRHDENADNSRVGNDRGSDHRTQTCSVHPPGRVLAGVGSLFQLARCSCPGRKYLRLGYSVEVDRPEVGHPVDDCSTLDQVFNGPLGMIYLCQAQIIEIDYFRQVVRKPVPVVG